MADVASIAVVGGSGFYEFLEDAEEVKLDTPFGAPSDPITVGEVAGRRVAFLPRHGRDHRFSPHKIPYRANMWALRSLGVRRVLAPTAVGSLTPSYGPGTLVIPDQLVDRTRNREQTYFDEGALERAAGGAAPGGGDRAGPPGRRGAEPGKGGRRPRGGGRRGPPGGRTGAGGAAPACGFPPSRRR